MRGPGATGSGWRGAGKKKDTPSRYEKGGREQIREGGTRRDTRRGDEKRHEKGGREETREGGARTDTRRGRGGVGQEAACLDAEGRWASLPWRPPCGRKALPQGLSPPPLYPRPCLKPCLKRASPQEAGAATPFNFPEQFYSFSSSVSHHEAGAETPFRPLWPWARERRR